MRIYVYIHTYAYTYIYICTRLYTYIQYIYGYTYIYGYIYIHTDIIRNISIYIYISLIPFCFIDSLLASTANISHQHIRSHRYVQLARGRSRTALQYNVAQKATRTQPRWTEPNCPTIQHCSNSNADTTDENRDAQTKSGLTNPNCAYGLEVVGCRCADQTHLPYTRGKS